MRMDPEDFEELLDLIGDDDVFDNTGDEQQDEPTAQLAVALSRLGSYGSGVDTLLPVGIWDRTRESCHTYTERAIEALLGLQDQYLAWPTPSQRRVHAARMAEKKFPGCVGFFTQTTITLSLDPLTDKHLYSHNVQVICDMDGRILKIFLGSSKRHNLCKSSLWKHPDRYFSKGEYLLADSTYPVSTIIVPPFTGDDLTLDQTRFNARLERHDEGPTLDICMRNLHNFMHDRKETQESYMRRQASAQRTTAPEPLHYETGEELRDSLVQVARRPGRKPAGIAKHQGRLAERS
ncbi:hypothetical protein BGZ68_000027 [Mortierella alpina]|nr:hypothetical protein BGZ68_000027 [Mortierella alpina]